MLTFVAKVDVCSHFLVFLSQFDHVTLQAEPVVLHHVHALAHGLDVSLVFFYTQLLRALILRDVVRSTS